MPDRLVRPRLCLITPSVIEPGAFVPLLAAALAGGDVASLLITAEASSPSALQRIAEALVPVAQARGAAAILHGDTRIAGRAGADGVHIDSGVAELRAALDSFRPKRIVGAGGARSRHEAMSLGDLEPDYLLFGRLDGDTEDGIHGKTLDLAEWWSGLVEIPAIVVGGRAVASVLEGRDAGVEFVALRSAVWENAAGPAAAVAEANRLLSSDRETAAS